MIDCTHAVRCEVHFEACTGLLIRSGRPGDFTDSAVESDARGRLHINGYIWASLLRRALARIDGRAGLAAEWGKMVKENIRVSPLWTEATLIAAADHDRVVNPGIRIDREWGTAVDGALYSDELAIPLAPIPCRFTLFCENAERAADMRDLLPQILWVVGQGIETVGGGWSYGFGRLKPRSASAALLDLRDTAGREALWAEGCAGDAANLDVPPPRIAAGAGWTALDVEVAVADGQMLAIHTSVPPLTGELPADMPDAFVFTRPRINSGSLEAVPVVTGKAFRQAVFSREVERRLRASGQKACLNTGDEKRTPAVPPGQTDGTARLCVCSRCLWFGDTAAAGMVSVGDAEIEGAVFETLHRIQLCEHSMQNIQLFAGEYLTAGNFRLRVLIDHARGGQGPAAAEACRDALKALLEEMRPDGKTPPGWYRLGAATTCTGQLVVKNVTNYSTGK